MKYQFSIRVGKSGDKNSAATKAVLDCNTLLAACGYKDFNLVLLERANKVSYYYSILKALIAFYFTIKKDSLVAIQYPMLNTIFKYFIKAAGNKNIKIFCVVHDIESLRLGGKDAVAVNREVQDLNHYDYLIVHNSVMLQWLKDHGAAAKMTPLLVFDYLSKGIPDNKVRFANTIVYAGNLTKSAFIYSLHKVQGWTFTVYGPNFIANRIKGENISWGGEFSPEQIVYELKGNFGLIWDGESIDRCDEILGNYLKYNNPHKFSLYLAAGLPVIAPVDSAIATIIKENNVGLLINSLHDLSGLFIEETDYNVMKENCLKMSRKVSRGNYFLAAIDKVEQALLA